MSKNSVERDPHLVAKEKFPKDKFSNPKERRMAIILEEPLFLPRRFVAKKDSIPNAEAQIARRRSSIVDGAHVKKTNAIFAFVPKSLTKETSERKDQTPPAEITEVTPAASPAGSLPIATHKDSDSAIISDINSSTDSGTESLRHTVFLLKKNQGVENLFENLVLRLLSKSSVTDASYTVKRVALFESDHNKLGVKWEDNLEILLSSRKMKEINPRTKEPYKQYDLQNNNEETKKTTELGYARVCGVLTVLGWGDWNPRNFYFNSITGRVVVVDVGTLVDRHSPNYYKSETERFPIYGSPQSNDFLRIFLGKENIGSAVQRGVNKFDELEKEITETTPERNDSRILSEAMCMVYNEGIDDELFRKIEKNLNADQSLIEPFIEFMRGLNDAIELSKDQTFLSEFKEKVSREAGSLDADIVGNQIKILKENGEKAEKQYKKLIILHSKIIAKLSRDQRKRKISDEQRDSVSDEHSDLVSEEKPSEAVKPDQTYELRTGREISDKFRNPESAAISVQA